MHFSTTKYAKMRENHREKIPKLTQFFRVISHLL